ncbi:hypothetical protein PMAYCL1PPCAC_31228 [Pristionchus mayeri]|uniref:CRAL-TRIO domain containing protein n=1 Tax=Pristionchus mayeri TaxID=1317129 RepID=A0AAN5ICF6_9BILA|nr:hypothetical protein PMAYCL1PPCAC_31228 [Pristionchus mayeri]
MVQTYQSPVRIYKHPFEVVMAAYEMRFPTCPQIPIFVGSEITYEYKSDDGAVHIIERKCELNFEVPYLLKKIASVDYVYFNQKNSLDWRKRTLLIEATNISFSSRIGIKENCMYYVHPENNEWTCFEQSASLDVKSFFGFEGTVEKIAVKQYGANLAKGKEILEFFIQETIKKGTDHLIPYTVKNGEDEGSVGDSAIDMSKECNGEEETPEAIIHRRESKLGKNDLLKNNQHTSFDDPDSKIESEYIKRFLGQLSQLEESRFCELKYGLQSHHKGKLPNDAHLLRFLRAREFDVPKAKEMILTSLLWRKQHNVDQILHEWQRPAVVKQFFPGCWHHSDRGGRPLYLLRLGLLDMKGLLRSIGMQNVVKLCLSTCEEGLNRAEEATKALGVPISCWSALLDLDGLSMRHLWRPGVQALLKIIEIVEAHYPETMGQVLVVRAPRVFPVLWTLISPFIDETTRNKFVICGGENMTEEMKKFLDDQHIPDFLDGPCLSECGTGGHIPKALYLPVDEQKEDDGVLSTMYTTASFVKGCPIEAVINVASTGCVLTWDFDVLKSECEFTVYHTPKMLDEVVHPHSPSLNPVEMVHNAISSAPADKVHTDPSLALGVDMTIVEKPHVFQEGDSMQGSHFCTKEGSYILQWKVPDVSVSASTTFDFSIHRGKIMYYTETLDSADFRGSVASLESCRSSFSSMAIVSQPSTPASVPRQKKLDE